MRKEPANDLRTSPRRIEDYALIGDCETAALVSRDGSIDWLCWPRFDSGACFAAILGRPEHGRWLIAPKDPIVRVGRKYLNGSLILVTAFETEQGTVELIDFMRPRNDTADLIRVVRGVSGRVNLRTEFILRFDYGSVVPWMERLKGGGGLRAIAGPEMAVLRTPVHLHGRNFITVGEFTVDAGQVVPFVLSYGESQSPPPPEFDPLAALQEQKRFGRNGPSAARPQATGPRMSGDRSWS
jgi:GH15 family glucan-1,4-alpha-glucosidase